MQIHIDTVGLLDWERLIELRIATHILHGFDSELGDLATRFYFSLFDKEYFGHQVWRVQNGEGPDKLPRLQKNLISEISQEIENGGMSSPETLIETIVPKIEEVQRAKLPPPYGCQDSYDKCVEWRDEKTLCTILLIIGVAQQLVTLDDKNGTKQENVEKEA